MPKKSKSRTSKNSLTKKTHMPIWAVALGLVVIVGLGIFFVYKSFASTGIEAVDIASTESYTQKYIYCSAGLCHNLPFNGATAINAYIKRGSKKSCPSGYYYTINPPTKNSSWSCLIIGA